MVFSSLVFLCIFFPIVFFCYYLIPSLKLRNFLLILSSLLFYAYGEPFYVILMIVSTIANYIFGRMMIFEEQRKRRWALFLAIIVNLSFLGVFKYADMMVETANALFGVEFAAPELELPIGISFYTFQAMSYVIDVYRKDVEIQKKYSKVLLYVSFFPQLIAGPIVKYHDIQEQINKREVNVQQIAEGFRRFIIGLSKKVLISNAVAVSVDTLYSLPLVEINIISAWIAALAYLVQIYFDFSGYSDMAIGLGHMFGFHFLENFNYPYISRSIKEFWRRWHISLSTWFKEYLYIPLGGNRKGKYRTLINKLIVFFCTGLWHGASWTFVVWGLWHGLFQILEELFPTKKMPKFIGHVYTLLVVILGFVLFRAENFRQGLYFFKQMFTDFNFSHLPNAIAFEQLTPIFLFTMVIAAIASCPVLPKLYEQNRLTNNKGIVFSSYIASILLLILCLLSLSGGAYNPFIYFRF